MSNRELNGVPQVVIDLVAQKISESVRDRSNRFTTFNLPSLEELRDRPADTPPILSLSAALRVFPTDAVEAAVVFIDAIVNTAVENERVIAWEHLKNIETGWKDIQPHETDPEETPTVPVFCVRLSFQNTNQARHYELDANGIYRDPASGQVLKPYEPDVPH